MTVRLFLATLFFSIYFSYSINYQLEGNNLDFINEHFILNKSNATRLDNEFIFDIYRLEFIISNPDKIKYNIKNINWIKTNHSMSDLNQYNLISISDVFNYKGCPSIYLDIFPYKVQDHLLYYAESIDIEFIIDESIEYHSCNPSQNAYNVDFIKNNLNRLTEVDYLIITKDFLFEAAENLKNIHSDLSINIIDVDSIYSLYDNSNQAIRNYVLDQIELNPTLNYLLILGDETVVPPIYCGTIPSDDYYTSSVNCAAIPQLATGRIPVTNINDANDIVLKIDAYIQNLFSPLNIDQSWRMSLSLISDDENNPNPNKYPELSHTENSDLLYQQIKNNLIINTFYGIDYVPTQNSDGLLHSNLTDDLISHINNGVAMINYIGHGNYNTLADEKILQLDRDINLINSLDYKLPIWVVGTCSFGEYDGKNSMAEGLLLKNNGAIAIISTVRGIGETSNINYLTKLFNEINDYLENNNNYDRLGDIFKNSKNDSPSEDLFHLFGDPALPLPFPKESSIIDNPISELPIGEYTSLNVGPYNANLNIFDKEKVILKGYETGDTVVYHNPGNSIYAGSFYESTCFITSLDASECDSCASAYIQINHDCLSYNKFQNILDLDITFDLGSSDNLESDFNGPQISFFLDDYRLIDNNEIVFQNNNILVQVSDESGINLMQGLGHNLRYWFNDEQYQNTIDSDEFSYNSDCDEQFIGYFNINLSNLNLGNNILYVEAWDNYNNKTLESISLNIEGDQFKAYDVYNFPNPFQYQTNFTFKISDYPAIATISIFDLNGKKIKVIDNYECLNSFCSIPWNGKNKYSKNINNGTYIYHLKLKNNNQVFENLYKITKLK